MSGHPRAELEYECHIHTRKLRKLLRHLPRSARSSRRQTFTRQEKLLPELAPPHFDIDMILLIGSLKRDYLGIGRRYNADWDEFGTFFFSELNEIATMFFDFDVALSMSPEITYDEMMSGPVGNPVGRRNFFPFPQGSKQQYSSSPFRRRDDDSRFPNQRLSLAL